MSLRLNLGAGGQRHPDWVAVDRAGDVDVRLDLGDDEWPWQPGSVDAIVMHHVLDLFAEAEMIGVLTRCHAALKPGATMRMSGADLGRGIHAALEGDEEWFAQPVLSLATGRIDVEKTLGFFIMQGGARKQWLTYGDLTEALLDVGFDKITGFGDLARCRTNIDSPEWLTDLDTRQGESWFAEAVK